MARTGVADFERDFDEAARCFADQLLRLQHALSGHELQRRYPRGLLEHAREMERAQLCQLSQRLDGDAFCEVHTHIVLDLAEPCDRQAAAIVRPLRCDVCVFLGDVNRQSWGGTSPRSNRKVGSKFFNPSSIPPRHVYGDNHAACFFLYMIGKTLIRGFVDS